MTTIDYIQNFKRNNDSVSLSKWMYDHPQEMRMVELGLVAFGLIAIAFTGSAFFAWGATGAALVGGGGAVAVLAGVITRLFLERVTCQPKEVGKRYFTEETVLGGRLYYRGAVPILELDGNDSRAEGYAHGYLLGRHIYQLKKNLDLAVHTVLRRPDASQLREVLQKVKEKILREYVEEMEGLVEGYNDWASRRNLPPMTFDELLLMHLLPDSKHFLPGDVQKRLPQPACTSILKRDGNGEVLLARNMDWCPFGEGGSKSLVIVWKQKGIAAIGVPGLIGVITGWNVHQLTMAMNVCPGKSNGVEGMPAIFLNRYLLENSETVQEVRGTLVNDGRASPLGAYHLTCADPQTGICISFEQQADESEDLVEFPRYNRNHIRELDGDEPLITLNWREPLERGGSFNSAGRAELLGRYFGGASGLPQADWPALMQGAIQLTPLVNSWITLHSCFFNPAQGEMTFAWDNGYAASSTPTALKMGEVFQASVPMKLAS